MKFNKIVLFVLIFISLNSLNYSKADDRKSTKIKKKKINVSLLSIAQKLKEVKADQTFYSINTFIANRWFPIVALIREGNIDRKDAVDSMYYFTNQLWDFMEAQVKAKKIKKYPDNEWVFPIRGYNPNAIGGYRGNGYIVGDFDFFDLNSGGHPAHDIFIDDVNQDCIDDITNMPAEIISMSGGIVVETRKNWSTSMMDIKGGNIVYVYDNYTNGFFYYAHMKDVYVNVGDLVEPGTPLGTIGRTGRNAYPSRSPTHLHIMYVRSFDGNLRPENIYNDLLKAKLTP